MVSKASQAESRAASRDCCDWIPSRLNSSASGLRPAWISRIRALKAAADLAAESKPTRPCSPAACSRLPKVRASSSVATFPKAALNAASICVPVAMAFSVTAPNAAMASRPAWVKLTPAGPRPRPAWSSRQAGGLQHRRSVHCPCGSELNAACAAPWNRTSSSPDSCCSVARAITHVLLGRSTLRGDEAQRFAYRGKAGRIGKVEPGEHLTDGLSRQLGVAINPFKLRHNLLSSATNAVG